MSGPENIGSFVAARRESDDTQWRIAGYERSGFQRASRQAPPLGPPETDPPRNDTGSFGKAAVSSATAVPQEAPRNAGFKKVMAGAVKADSQPAIESPAATRAVRILSKPKPEYTDEARRQRIEGDVRLQVRFQADATVTVLRVIKGLGYGLDQNAIYAASRIQFVPAARNSKAIPFVTDVFIRFRLAY